MPKLYSSKSSIASVGGANVHLRYTFFTNFKKDFVTKNLQGPIEEGIAAIQYLNNLLRNHSTSGIAQNENLKSLVSKYFFVEEMDEGTLQTLRVVLQLMNNGLQAGATVKIFGNTFSKGKLGYVTTHLKSSFRSNQSHRNPGFYTKTSDGSMATLHGYKGDVHIGYAKLGNLSDLQNSITFVHELSHKYADTADFGEKGYTNSMGNYRQKGLTHLQALMNADSFANLIMRFYRMENNLNTW